MQKGKEIADELKEVAPSLSVLGDSPAYEVPNGYFEAFPDNLMAKIRTQGNTQEVTEELSELSPFLASMSRKTPFSAPDGYFEDLGREVIMRTNEDKPGRIVKMGRRVKLFKRCLVAAAIAGVISVGAVMLSKSFNDNSLDRQLAQISDQEIEDYLQSNTDAFDNENIFTNVSLEDEDATSVLPDELSEDEIENYLEDNLLKELPLNQ
jgi:putative ribosome biogenesis GTPase RsgA